MTVGVKVKANRTTGTGPPPDLLFGEIAYSDADQQLYVGRPAPAPPTIFKGNQPDYSAAIAALANDLATLDSSDTAQATAIATIAVEQGVQNDAIAALNSTTGDHADAIAALTTSDAAQDTAIAALILNDEAQDTAIAALQALPVTHGFTYDQQAEPTSPASGATWRERSSGGLIVGEWEWLAVHAEWVAIARYDLNGLAILGSSTGEGIALNCSRKKRLIVSGHFQIIYFSGTAISATNYYTHTIQLKTLPGSLVANLNPLASVFNSGTYAEKIAAVDLIYEFSYFTIYRAATGSPGQTRSHLTLTCRDVRP